MDLEVLSRSGSSRTRRLLFGAIALAGLAATGSAFAAALNGQVLGGGAPIASSTVTLWAASAGAPKQLAQARSDADGRFTMTAPDSVAADTSLYLVAQRGQPDGQQGERRQSQHRVDDRAGQQAADQGHDQRDDDRGLGVDPRAVPRRHRDQGSCARPARSPRATCPTSSISQTGGWGGTIQDPLNSSQTPTMANFATLADVLAGCVTRVTADACEQALRGGHAAEGRCPDRHADGGPVDRALSVVPARATSSPCSNSSIRCPQGKTMRAVPYMPYLELRAQRLGAAAQVRRRRVSRGRQGDVRQRGQSLGRRQLHRRLAGAGHLVAGQRHQVRPERQAAVADHDRLYRRRDAGRHLRRGGRRQRQCLAHQLRRQVDHGVRQERQAADAARTASPSTASSG